MEITEIGWFIIIIFVLLLLPCSTDKATTPKFLLN